MIIRVNAIRSPWGMGLVVSIVALLLGSATLWQIQVHHIKSDKLHIHALLANHALQLERDLKQGMAVNELLGQFIHSNQGQLDNFESIAKGLLDISPNVSHFSLAPDGIIQKVYPLPGNEASLGFNLLEDPNQGPDALKSKQLRQQTLSGPIHLVQGGQAFILRYPVFLDSADDQLAFFWGLSSVILNLDTLIESSGIKLLSNNGINYRFYHQAAEGDLQLIHASSGALLSEVIEFAVSLPNGRWLLVASPENSWIDPVHFVLEALPILLISILLGVLAAQMRRTKRINTGLEETVLQRTAELQIAAIAFQSQNGILVTDPKQHIIKVNKAFQAMTGYSESEVIGKTPALLNSGRHDASFYQQMYTRLLQNDTWQGEIWNRRKCGEVYPEHLTITAIRNNDGELTHYIASLVDITELKATQDRVYQLKYFDTLTNLPNRNQLRETLLEVVWNEFADNQQVCGSLLFIDLDHFKQFNDALGQSAGDELLRELANRLNTLLPKEASLARLGSDEFVILLQQTDANESKAATTAEKLAELIISIINEPFELTNQSHRITASIGVTLINYQADPDDLLKQSELAMFEAKSKGRNRINFYEQSMQAQAIQRLELQSDMYDALKKQQFELYYQPQFDATCKIKGVEALLRWVHPLKGNISPGEFIPLAEETDLILKIGAWVLETALNQSLDWSNDPLTRDIIISINVSARQFSRPDFVQQVKHALIRSGANPQRLQLELTESMLVNDTQDIIDKMMQLKQLGLLIALDDFGTGYSSLSYVQKLPLDQLKVDKSFVWDINPEDPQKSLAATIIALGRSLDLEVIAEGVETQQQMDFLKDCGCHLYQGFLLAKPLKLQEFNDTVSKPVTPLLLKALL